MREFLSLENTTVKIVGDLCLDTYHRYMDKDSAIYIKYAAKYDMLSNYWKYSIGQNKGLKTLGVADRKKKQEVKEAISEEYKVVLVKNEEQAQKYISTHKEPVFVLNVVR